MALNTAMEMELKNTHLIDDFHKDEQQWVSMAREAYAYTCKTVDGTPKQDDVAPHLALALQSCERFLVIRSERKVIAKKWYDYFAALIIDRTWSTLTP